MGMFLGNSLEQRCGHERSSRPQRLFARRHRHSLKEVVPIGAVKFTAEHAAVLEIYGLTSTDTGHCGRAFR
jgi:hypothetical protein